jgi:hypothetical protein
LCYLSKHKCIAIQLADPYFEERKRWRGARERVLLGLLLRDSNAQASSKPFRDFLGSKQIVEIM